jgi:hypothetical protein
MSEGWRTTCAVRANPVESVAVGPMQPGAGRRGERSMRREPRALLLVAGGISWRLKAMNDVTRIVSAIEQGDPIAAGQLLPLR